MQHFLKFFLFVFFLLPLAAFSCLNGTDGYLEKLRSKVSGSWPVPKAMEIQKHDPEFIMKFELSESIAASNEKKDLLNFAIMLILKGDYEKAEEVLVKCAKSWPKDYEVASNYGTILEVNGNPAKALTWIQKAVKINPSSHGGSEWIHVEILKAKVKKKLPSGEEMTKTDFGQAAQPNCSLPDSALLKLQIELYYQLKERLTFIEPEDHFIAELAWVLANVDFCLGDHASASKTYDIAKQYGYQNLELLESRKAAAVAAKKEKARMKAEKQEVEQRKKHQDKGKGKGNKHNKKGHHEGKMRHEAPQGPNWLAIAVAAVAFLVMTGAAIRMSGAKPKQ